MTEVKSGSRLNNVNILYQRQKPFFLLTSCKTCETIIIGIQVNSLGCQLVLLLCFLVESLTHSLPTGSLTGLVFDLLTETLSQLLLKYAVSQLFKRPVSERLTRASENLDVISCVKGVVEINLSRPPIWKPAFKSLLSAQHDSRR